MAQLAGFSLRHRRSRRHRTPSKGSSRNSARRRATSASRGHQCSPSPTVSTRLSDWPDFRGPNRDGHYTARPILTAWPNAELKPIWKQPVGGGYASFVATRIGNLDLAFTIEQRGNQEVVAAYDVATGREQWITKWSAEFKEFMGGDGHATTPPTRRLCLRLGGTGELRRA